MTVPHINPSQKTAAHPKNSCWVEASAGSGKTKVLTDRVLNLLLHGADPEKILCLTFTKAAAAEMANRLRTRLSNWATLDKDALQADLKNLVDQNPEKYLENARHLFSKFVDTPGGLKIQTIHSFCHALLKKFPLESGIVPHFSVIDEEEQKKLHQKSFSYALKNSDPSVLEIISNYLSIKDLEDTLNKLKSNAKKLDPILKKHPEVDSYMNPLKENLGLKNYVDEEHIIQEFFKYMPDFSPLFDAYDFLPDKDKTLVGNLKLFNKDFEKYKLIFLTLKDTIRKKILWEKNEDFEKLIQVEAERVFETTEKIKHMKICKATKALLKFYLHYFNNYETLKQHQNVLDYDDLIQKTKTLLENSDLQPWVLYKLDGGIDHILVDEAQDTNHTQWNIIAAIAKEFFTGASAKEIHRTLFIVGDTKQSIYGFQGANPEIFDDVRSLFSSLTKSVNHPWQEIDLNVSYRSTPSVLKAVDSVFHQKSKLHKKDQAYTKHIAHRQNDAGRVEVWPLTQPEKTDDILPWTLPKEQNFYKSTRRKLAEEIAKTIQQWIQKKKILQSKGRPIDPGDIMILVRRRDQFVAEMVRALKRHTIHVTGIDRMVLTDQLPIMDLIIFTEFLLLPDDSLKMATVLKSPILNFSEQDLFDLCHNRPFESLWQTLKARKDARPIFQKAFDTLHYFLGKIDFLTPYEFFMEVLSTQKIKHNFLKRLGTEIEDALDEFLNICLTYEQNHIPSLQNFVHWIQTNPPEIKRNLEQSVQGKVRIMTVHGSKGLQSPIVFLPDTTNVPSDRNTMIWGDQNSLFAWCPKSNLMTEPLNAYKAPSKELTEYNRLLYVAMTRAEDHLYVCGWQPQRALDEESWYSKISGALEPIAKKEEEILVLENPQLKVVEPKTQNKETPLISLPEWFEKGAPLENREAVINPSKIEDGKIEEEEILTKSASAPRVFSAADRGNLIHKILQWILKSPPEDRSVIIQNYLKKQGVPLQEIDPIKNSILKTLDCKDLQPFLQGNYICEMPITGTLPEGIVKGIIDLVHFDFDKKIISVLDYKTGSFEERYRITPPEHYVQQLLIYKKVLQKIYPDVQIKTYLVWTEGPYVIKIESEK